MKLGKLLLTLLCLAALLVTLTGCASDSGYSYSTRESQYDAKYGQGEYRKDVDLYNSMKNAWPGN